MAGFIKVASSERCIPILLPTTNGVLRKETLVSQFPGATGLKYCDLGCWMAVEAREDVFHPPLGGWGNRSYVIAMDSIGRAREVLSNPGSLARDVSKVFSFNPPAPVMSKKQIKTAKKNVEQKVVKVIFLHDISFPSTISGSKILVEGMFNMHANEEEDSIKNKLCDILKQSLAMDVQRSQIQYVCCSHKKLTLPAVSSSSFSFNASGMKSLMGQGKLYVHVKEIQGKDSSDMIDPDLDELPSLRGISPKDGGSPESSDELPQIVFKANENKETVEQMEEVPEDTGTPTVTFKSRRRRSLSLNRKRTSNLRSQEDMQDTGSYRSYISLFSSEVLTVSDDSDNEEIYPESSCSNSSQTLTDILLKLRASLDTEKTSRFNINRNDLIGGVRRAIKRKSFDPTYKISVKFSDDCGMSEGAVDQGGPTRELLRMLIRKFQQLPIFDGPNNSRYLTLNSTALSDGLYHDVGVMLSMSLVHGGPAPRYFSKLLYCSIAHGVSRTKATIEDVNDADIKLQIEAVLHTKDLTDTTQVLDKMTPLLLIAGCLRPVYNNSDKEQLVQHLINFFVLGRNTEALAQLSAGLETLGVLKEIQQHPQLMEELFCFATPKLTAESLEVVFHDIQFSEKGSNHRMMEEQIISYWRDFLLDIEEQEDGDRVITLKDILVFATGADEVPPMGFDPLPSISFVHESERFPKANTCAMILSLPYAKHYGLFKENMIFGIGNSPGFGMA